MYSCVCTSVSGFIQQLAASYISNGYFFYVTGVIPSGNDPAKTDAKLVEKYDLNISKWTRHRRKLTGQSSIQYLRYEHFFVLLATRGASKFFEEEGDRVRDARRVSVKAFGYAVSFKRGAAHVSIEHEEFKRLLAYFVEIGTHRRSETVETALRRVSFEPYRPVRRQLLGLLRRVNAIRKKRAYELISVEVLPTARNIVSPFHSDLLSTS